MRIASGPAALATCGQLNTLPSDLDIFSPARLRKPLCIQ